MFLDLPGGPRQPLPHSKPSRPSGLTVAEVIVSMALLLLLSAMFTSLFAQARSSTDGGGARIELRAQHRSVMQRLTLLLRAAIPPTEVDPAVSHPPIDEADAEIHFHAPADLLDPEAPFAPRTPDYPAFRIGHDPITQQITVRRLDNSGPTQQLGRTFDSLSFHRPDERTVEIVLVSSLETRGAGGSSRRLEERSQTVVNLLKF